jgi:hypothetical protein
MASQCNPAQQCTYKGCLARVKISNCVAIDYDTGEVDWAAFLDVAQLATFSFTENTAVDEDSCLTDCAPQYEFGDTTWTGNLEVKYCLNDESQCFLRSGCANQLCVAPIGGDPSANDPAYYGEMLGNSFGHTFTRNAKQRLTLGFQGNGELFRENWCIQPVPLTA